MDHIPFDAFCISQLQYIPSILSTLPKIIRDPLCKALSNLSGALRTFSNLILPDPCQVNENRRDKSIDGEIGILGG